MARFEMHVDIEAKAYEALKNDSRFIVDYEVLNYDNNNEVYDVLIKGKKKDLVHMARTLAQPRKLLLRDLAELITRK